MKLSMIVEITSLTPRVTLSTPAIEAHAAPTTIATSMMKLTWNGAGSVTARAAAGGQQRRQQVLALDADVEQVHLEPDRDGERRRRRAERPG